MMHLIEALLCNPPERIALDRGAAQNNLALLRGNALTICQSIPLADVHRVFDVATSLEQHVTVGGLSADQLLLLAALATIGVQALHVEALEAALSRIADRLGHPTSN